MIRGAVDRRFQPFANNGRDSPARVVGGEPQPVVAKGISLGSRAVEDLRAGQLPKEVLVTQSNQPRRHA